MFAHQGRLNTKKQGPQSTKPKQRLSIAQDHSDNFQIPSALNVKTNNA